MDFNFQGGYFALSWPKIWGTMDHMKFLIYIDIRKM